MLKMDRSGVSKNKVFSFLDKKKDEKAISQLLLKQEDIIFFFRYVERHDLREKAFELLQEKMGQPKLH